MNSSPYGTSAYMHMEGLRKGLSMRKEMRAATSHQFEYILAGTFRPENIHRVVDDLASHHYNAVQVCVRAPGIHFYPSDIGPVHPFCREYDFLGEFVEKSHQAGLQIYSYYPVFLEGGVIGSPVAGSSLDGAPKKTSRGQLGGILEKHPGWACLGGKNGELRPDNLFPSTRTIFRPPPLLL